MSYRVALIVKTSDLPTLSGSACAGMTMGAINDLDGDGYAELMVADPSIDGTDGFANGGAVYILNGDDLSDGADIKTDATWTIESKSGGAWLRVSDTRQQTTMAMADRTSHWRTRFVPHV